MGELVVYVGRIREFRAIDWVVYLGWVGLLLGLTTATGGLLIAGHVHGVTFPAAAWCVPAGAAIFPLAVAIDTIGHRTIYKQEIQGAEGLVHGITIFCGITSCVLLTAAYHHPRSLWIPALVLTILAFVYSLVDEAFHWRRYVSKHSDRVEMWSHVGILTGHAVMMIGWWSWFFQGYPGVTETLQRLGASA